MLPVPLSGAISVIVARSTPEDTRIHMKQAAVKKKQGDFNKSVLPSGPQARERFAFETV